MNLFVVIVFPSLYLLLSGAASVYMASMHQALISYPISPLVLSEASSLYWLASTIGLVLGSSFLSVVGYRRFGIYMLYPIVILSGCNLFFDLNDTTLLLFELSWGWGMAMAYPYAVGIWLQYFGPKYSAGIVAVSLLLLKFGLAFQPLQTLAGLAYGVVWVDMAFLLIVLFALLLLHVSDDLVDQPAASKERNWLVLVKDNVYQQLSIARSPTLVSLLGANVMMQSWLSYVLVTSVVPQYIASVFGLHWIWLLAPVVFLGGFGSIVSGLVYKKPVVVILTMYACMVASVSVFVWMPAILSVWAVACLIMVMVFCLNASVSYLGSYICNLYNSSEAVNAMAFWGVLASLCFSIVRFSTVYVLAPNHSGSMDFTWLFKLSLWMFTVSALVSAATFLWISKKRSIR